MRAPAQAIATMASRQWPARQANHGKAPPIFFHPDYDRRPWHLTRSADPALQAVRALAGSSRANGARHTAGGDFHPALKT
jgi:hypothetical protein